MISPRDNAYLVGHGEAEEVLLKSFVENNLHNSWLISGVEGIGKATLAYKFARFVLNYDASKTYSSLDVSPDCPIFKLVSNNAHPDFKIIERDFTDTDKRKIIKAIKDGDAMDDNDLKALKKSSVIKIDEVRTINEFLSKRSANDGWRVVLVDSVDEMNGASANAVLKILEEPPYKTLILLISHNPNKLLPTIKSRCAKMQLKPLKDEDVASLLRRYGENVSEAEIKEIVKASGGSIGKALRYTERDFLKKYDALCRIVYAKEKFKIKELLDFVNVASGEEDSFELAKEIIFKLLKENAKNEEMFQVWDNTIKVFDDCERLNMDKKQVLINVINGIAKAV